MQHLKRAMTNQIRTNAMMSTSMPAPDMVANLLVLWSEHMNNNKTNVRHSCHLCSVKSFHYHSIRNTRCMQRDASTKSSLASTRTEYYVASKEDHINVQENHVVCIWSYLYYAFYWYKREVSLRSSSFPNRHMMCRERMLQRERTTSSKELPCSSPFPQESIVDY